MRGAIAAPLYWKFNVVQLIMRNEKAPDRIKISQLYTNCSISTKCFDGTTLYEMFLSNQRAAKFANLQRKQESAKRTNQGEEESVVAAKKNSPLFEIGSLHMHHASLEFKKCRPLSNILPPKQIYQRGCQSNQSCYEQLSSSLGKAYEENNNIRIAIKQHRNQAKTSEQTLRMRTNSSKKKVEYGINDFATPEQFESDPMLVAKPSDITASSVSIIRNKKRVCSLEGDCVREIASLTKIMTCIVCLYLAKKFELDIGKEEARVSRKAAEMIGTSAELQKGDTLKIQDLLYGMMLPSGNDAAYCLAEYFSKKIYSSKHPVQKKQIFFRYNTLNLKKSHTMNSIVSFPSEFILEMNKLAAHLRLANTHFSNPHGLSDQSNTSTSNDIAQLCHHAMRNQTFRKIVSTREYEANVFSTHQKIPRKIRWENTNKLLQLEHCCGIKTGVTPTAGPCMSAYFEEEGCEVIIVILNSRNKAARFREVKKLFEWAKDA